MPSVLRYPNRRQAMAALGPLALAPLHGQAQTFPGKPIRVLIGVPAGGTQDVLTRAIADQVRSSLGPLIIDNRGGAAGRIAVDVVKNAEPDGHALLLGTAGMMTLLKTMREDTARWGRIMRAVNFQAND